MVGANDSTPSVIVWSGITFYHKMPLVHIDVRLTADHCVTQVVEHVLSFLLGAAHTVFQQDCQAACWMATSLDLTYFLLVL
ncbi:hypothetical protein TNCV_3530821 [Trichonephila clavipes]|uniref:Uncharacterized protein n=1 Tax=Trichonephila clavipes TaxID=2585209 RepID=A0A8X6SLT4_TRICX|nr:hypothetical protein TNCV_3530821 [Trichonephila clavipes]